MFRFSRCVAAAALVLTQAFCGAALAAPAAGGSPDSAAADALAPAFDVEAYDVEGNSLLDPVAVETAVYPFLGPGRSKADIDHARQALEDVYHGHGYDTVVVEIPAQTVADHVVRLHVVETTVGRLRVTGTRYYSIEDVKKQAPALAEGQVPNFREAQGELAELNREPGRQVTPVIRPGKVPGTVDIDLKVAEQAPVHASLEINNDHPVDTQPLRMTATIRYDNLWQAGHKASFSYAVAPQARDQSEVFAASYLAPIPDSRWTLLAYGYNSNSNVATLGDVAVLGKGWAAGVRAIGQLPSMGPVAQTVSAGLDFKHFFQLLSTGDGKLTPVETAVDYVPLVFVYSLQFDTAASSTHASFSATAGVRSNAGDEATFQESRAFAHGNFIHVNLDLDHTQNLPRGFAANVRLTGQVANQPLISGEQFSAGGLSSVRGYPQAAAVGDDGAFASLELRSPVINLGPRWLVDDWRIYVFGDAADTRLISALAGQRLDFSIYSAGVGTRFQLLQHLDGDLLVGFPMAALRGADARRAYTMFSLKAGF
jgi:hemolysin activation/secretion protein